MVTCHHRLLRWTVIYICIVFPSMDKPNKENQRICGLWFSNIAIHIVLWIMTSLFWSYLLQKLWLNSELYHSSCSFQTFFHITRKFSAGRAYSFKWDNSVSPRNNSDNVKMRRGLAENGFTGSSSGRKCKQSVMIPGFVCYHGIYSVWILFF